MKEAWKDIKQGYKFLSKHRYKKFPHYTFDRLIFNVMMFIIFGFLFFVADSHNWELDYYVCPDGNADGLHGSRAMLKNFEPGRFNGSCVNPFYKESWKNSQYLLPGEYGTKPTKLFNSMTWIVMLLFASAFVINHYIHNRGVKFDKIFD